MNRLSPHGFSWLTAVALAFSLCACGDDSGGDSTTDPTLPPLSSAKMLVQESLELVDFESLMTDHEELAGLSAGLVLEFAGVVEDTSGKSITWAEGSTETGGRRTLIWACENETCQSAIQTISGGSASWEGPGGESITPWVLGVPILLKDLIGHDLKNGTTLTHMGGLSTKTGAIQLDSADPPTPDYKTRRFVALNTFGDVYSLSLKGVTDAVQAHGGFDEIVEIPYAREEAVTLALEDLDAHDAMLWLTQGVREERKSNWTQSRTLALTVNRGAYGETMMARNALAEAADFNVAGGPGIVFLAASQSHSDGTDGQPDDLSIWESLQDGDRIVIGVRGHADVGRILQAATAFFDAYFAGDTSLADALAAGSVHLEDAGASLVSSATDETVTWLRRFDDIWDGLGFTPTSGQLIVPITAIPYCGTPGSWDTAKLESYTQPFINELTFDGAYVSGSREVVFSEDYTVSMDMSVLLTGFEVNDRIYVQVSGDFDEQYRDYHAWCEGVIRETNLQDDGGKLLYFDGPCHTTEYTDETGQSCILNSPQMSTTTSVKATLELTP